MGKKVAKKWDRKLRNRAAKKDARRAAAQEFQERLEAPRLASGAAVTGSNKEKHRKENKRKRIRM
jgi:hypothetical protein